MAVQFFGRPFFVLIRCMKKILLFIAAGLCSQFSLQAQDKIFKRNGLLIFTEVKALTDSGIVYQDDLGALKTVPFQSVRAIQYAIGNVLPISGAMARKYREEAFVYYPVRSNKQIQLSFQLMNRVLGVGYEYFFERTHHSSIAASLGAGIWAFARFPYYNDQAQTIWLANASWRRYPSLMRTFRFHYGIRLEVSEDRVKFEGYSHTFERRVQEVLRITRIGGGPEIGISGYVYPNISFSGMFSPQIIGFSYHRPENVAATLPSGGMSHLNPQLTFTLGYTL